MPIYRATSQNPTTNLGTQPAGNLPASLLDAMYQTLWNVLNDSSNGFSNLANDVGTANNYVVTNLSPAITYRQGMWQAFLTANSNTGASQINIDGLGNVAITATDGTPLVGGEISAVSVNMIIHDGTRFRLVLPFLNSVISQIIGWAAYQGTIVCTTNPNTVQNWGLAGAAGLKIQTSISAGGAGFFAFTVPGASLIQLTILTDTADNNLYQVYLVSEGPVGQLVFGNAQLGPIPGTTLQYGPVGKSTTMAGFVTKGTFVVNAQTMSTGQTGQLDLSMGIVTLMF